MLMQKNNVISFKVSEKTQQMMSEELNIPVSKSNIGHLFRKIEYMAKLYEKLK